MHSPCNAAVLLAVVLKVEPMDSCNGIVRVFASHLAMIYELVHCHQVHDLQAQMVREYTTAIGRLTPLFAATVLLLFPSPWVDRSPHIA